MGAFDDLIPSKTGAASNGVRPAKAGAFDDLIPAKPAVEESSEEGWGSWLMGGVEAAGDAIGSGAISSVERVPSLLGNVVQGTGRLIEGAGDAIEHAMPISGMSEEDIAKDTILKTTTDKVGGWIRSFKPAQERQPNISMDQLWEAPLSRAVPFAIEQGLASLPDMVAAVAALPLYVAGRTNEIGEDRAKNDGRKPEDVTFGDLMKAAPAAVASALLEKVGAKGVFGLDDAVGGVLSRGLKSGAKEAGTEGSQEGVEYLGEQLGTQKGVTWTEAGKRMATGALAGGIFGGTLGAGVAAAEGTEGRAARESGGAFDDLLPEGAGRAEDILDDVVVPVPADRERLDSTRLTEEDRASPIPNDLIDDGKMVFEGKRPGELRSPQVQNDITFGRDLRSTMEEAVPASSIPSQGLAPQPNAFEDLDLGPQFDADIQSGSAAESDLPDIDMSEIEDRIRQDVEEDSLQGDGPRPSFLDQFSPAEATAYAQAPGVNRAIARRLGVKIDEMESRGDLERAGRLRSKLGPILESFGAGSSATVSPISATEARTSESAAAPSATGSGLMPTGDGTRRAPVVVSGAADLDGIAKQIASPTEGQAEAGNYQKGHARWNGLQLAIETPRGGKRSGTDATGSTWEVDMPAHYGDFKGTKGADGDPVDVYVGEDPTSDTVFIVDQKDAETGEFDEHKVFIGTKDEAEVAGIYEGAFSDGRGGSRLADITETNVAGLKDWLANGDTSKPFGSMPAAKPAKPGKLAKKPVAAMLRKAGGVDPASTLAGELLSMGVTSKTAPGLFRKGGIGAADNFVRAEHPLFEFGRDDGNGYIPEADILEAMRREIGGDPLRSADEAEREQAAQPVAIEEEAQPAERPALRSPSRTISDPAAEVDRLIDVYGYPDSPELRQTASDLIKQGVDPEDAMIAATERFVEQLLQPTERASVNEASGIPFFAGDPGFDDALDGTVEVATEDREGIRADQPRDQEGGERSPAGAEGGPRDSATGDGSERAPASRSVDAQPVEAGADGKPQLVIPGAERASDRTMAQRAADAPMRAKAAQKDASDGLFGSSKDQLDLVDLAKASAPRAPEMSAASRKKQTASTDAEGALFSEPSTEAEAETTDGTDADFRRRAEGWETVDFEPEPVLTQAEQDAVVAIVRRVSGLSEVQFHDVIRVPTTAKGFKAWGREGKPGEVIQVAGFYHSMKDVIAVALNTGGDARRVAFHESFHRLQSMFLTDQEKALLQAETEALRAIVAAVDGREDQASRMSQIEIEAEAFAIYAERMEQGGRAPLQIKGRIRAAWDRIRAMGRRVRNYLNGRGYQTFEDVFDMARSGDMKARAAGKGSSKADTSYSLMNDDATELTEAEPQRKTAGFLAKGQPLDRALRIPFEMFGGMDANGEWKPGKYLTAKAGKIITDAKFSPDGRMSWMNGALETARAGLIDRYGLDAAYVERDQGRALDERAIMYEGVELLKSLAEQNMSVSEAKVLQAMLTGEAVNDAEMAKLAEPIRLAIDELGQEAVQLGLLSAESYERNRGAYLHRVYMKHEMDQSGLTKMVGKIMGGSRQKIIGDQFKGRGMFFEVPAEAATRNLAEVVRQRREDALSKDLGEKLDRLAARRKVAAARLEESQSETAINMARLMDIAEAAREQKGGARPYQNGQMREQGVAMTRLRKKAEQANRVLAKIDAEADAATVKLDGLKASRVVVGKFMPVKGETFNVLVKKAVIDGKKRVTQRVYIPTKQSIPAEYSGFESQGEWEVRGAKGEKVILWRDYTKDERGKMGEILDARYTIGKTYLMMAHDLATGRFYRDIAGNEEWSTKEVPEGAKWENAAKVKRLAIDPDLQWVKVPDDAIPNTGGKKRWGSLAGQFVRAEIWRDLNELEVMQGSSVWRMLLSQWKLNKTARSPVTHMNNVMSNLMFMDLADVRAQDLVAGIRSYAKGDADYEEAAKHGAFGVDMMAQEIRKNFLQPILDDLAKSEQDGVENSFLARAGFLGRLADQIWTTAKKADGMMIDAYRVEDEVFRMATFMRRRAMGDDARQAAKVARETFMDYDIRAPWVNAARNSVLPFASYTYRAAPMIAKAVAARPWKIAKYATIAYALNALAYAWDDDGDEEKERASLRDEEKGKTWLGVPRMMRMPFRNDDGLPVFLDVRRWMPAGDIFDTNQGSAAIPVPSPLQFGGPLMMAFEIMLNKQAFTGEEISNDEIDTTAERAKKVGDYLWKGWLPSAAWVPGSWYWDKIKNAATGATDGQGRPYDLPSALSSSIGIKLKPQDVESGLAWQFKDLQKVEQELKAEAKRLARQRERNLISQSAFDAGMATFMEKVGRVNEKAQELQRASGG